MRGNSLRTRANARYGDNTPVADGFVAGLQWRLTTHGAKFAQIAIGRSKSGTITFHGTFPVRAHGQAIVYRVCAQPQGRTVCSATLHSHIK